MIQYLSHVIQNVKHVIKKEIIHIINALNAIMVLYLEQNMVFIQIVTMNLYLKLKVKKKVK